ncbi:MAG: hypothetical protein AAFP82_20350, partial [Bacteroidota bacterium]
YNGKKLSIKGRKTFNQTLSKIIEDVYSFTPALRNELMNKTKVSSSIHLAKKHYIGKLIKSWNKPSFGFEDKKFPPDRTIYITLLKETGIHYELNPFVADFQAPKDQSFLPIWNASIEFLNSAKSSKRKLTEFVETLAQKPFKLKDGLLEFWLITFLFIRREDFALFKDDRYIPFITEEVALLFMRDAAKYEIKSFDIEGVKLDLFNKYRELTQQATTEKATATSFQDMARPFLVFYGQLPNYAQQTKSVSYNTIAFREKIAVAKELEKTFFEDIPLCFGYNLEQLTQSEEALEQFVNQIQASIVELRTAYDNLLDRVEQKLLEILGLKENTKFEDYKRNIQKRYKSIKKHLLIDRHKTFYSRIQSKLDDRKAWLNSLVQALMGKQLDKFKDNEVPLLNERLMLIFKELDNYTELSVLEYDDVTEEALKIEITGFGDNITRKNIILSKNQQKQVEQLEQDVRSLLQNTNNESSKQAVLIRLLREVIKDDKS